MKKHWQVWLVLLFVLVAGVFMATLMGHVEVFTWASGLLQLAIIVVLIQAYRHTRDVGFVWLGMAVVIWPMVSGLLQVGERSVIDRMSRNAVAHQAGPVFMWGYMTMGTFVTFLGMVRNVIGGGLMLVAVVYLGRTRTTKIVDGVAI